MSGRFFQNAGILACALAALLSCRTTDVVVQSAGKEEIAALDSFEMRLLELRIAPDAAALAALRAELDRAAARPRPNRRVSARLDAQRAEAALLARDSVGARKLVEGAAAASEAEEGVWIVRSGLEADPKKRLQVIEQGLARADEKGRLLCERGRALLQAGRYAEAAQDLDEGLRGLDSRYQRLYGPDRERAFSLAQAARDSGGAAPVMKPDTLLNQLTILSMVELASSTTRFLLSLSSRQNPSFSEILPGLTAAGLLLQPNAPQEALATRKSVAFFLWGIVAREEHDPKLLTRYRLKYSVSPVPDLLALDPWFDAALGVVEREIMDLPDGTNFRPDLPVTGIEYSAMLSRLKKLYP
jgi:hypothetical protein